ncbi:hypothetical protein [Streptomyces sp. NPDC050738]|uniref:hypothetical protein n=1 Tax=Streptomyces sp. NPDC050738 TaxID=3154744 RepID=UPI00343C8B1A
MSERLTLPSGAWVELRDPATMLRGDKKKVMRGISDIENPMATGYDLTDGLLQVLVVAWSYELPLPSVSPESLELLPLNDDERLMEITEAARDLIFPKKSEPTPEQVADPASPTVPSAE